MSIKERMRKMPILRRCYSAKRIYAFYKNQYPDAKVNKFIINHFFDVKEIRRTGEKCLQICQAIKRVQIMPANNNSFFYSIDPFLRLETKAQVLDNYSIDYSWVVGSSFMELRKTDYSGISQIIDEMIKYVKRIKTNKHLPEPYIKNIEEIESIFSRPAIHLHEAIQRILFINQWLWQTGHKHNGFGHLDWILYDLYTKDIEQKIITKEEAKQYFIDFFNILHDKCWYKSTMLLGDTGQIVILGGIDEKNNYRCNELTYLFIQVSKELKLPDPKVLLRVSESMPDELLSLAMECIATGIGAPFLSNDDAVIPSLIQFGYEKEDAYGYATSACWEPLTIGKSCDQNNIRTVNFCEPFVQYIDSEEFEKCQSIDDVKKGYYLVLGQYLDNFLSVNLDNKEFEEDPLLTMFNPEVLKTGKDITHGGAKYSNLGLTSVGMSTVVNSLLNLEHFVFDEKQYTLYELNKIRKANYEENEDIRQILYSNTEAFGNDNSNVIELTNEIMFKISEVIERHHTKLGGKYKYGLSSPNYIVDSKNMSATFDGRKDGQPFGVHISGKNGLSPTELISFASQINYSGNRINGNVIDFIMSPGFINNNMKKAVQLIKGGIKQGFYQLQINVVDSKTLIEAQKNPDKFPNLVVRVWGFSAYFKDLPIEYQNNLIRRAIEAETAA